MFRAVEALHALDDQGTLPRPVNPRPAGVEEGCQVRDFGFPGGVGEYRDAFGRAGGDHEVLGGPHAGEVQGAARSLQAAPGVAAQPPVLLDDAHAQGPHGLQVHVDGALADLAAAGRTELRAAHGREQRP